MGKVEIYEKLNKPGLWFVRSEHPASELKQYIYDFAVESGVPIVVYSGIPKKEISAQRNRPFCALKLVLYLYFYITAPHHLCVKLFEGS